MRNAVPLSAAAAAGVTVALIGYQLLVGPSVENQQDRLPPAVRPAGNGLIAYSFAGDIFVSDPTSGEMTVIVSGPDSPTNPIFSRWAPLRRPGSSFSATIRPPMSERPFQMAERT